MTPLEYLKAISETIGKMNAVTTEYSDISDDSEEEEELSPTNVNICVVCLSPRTTTWLFLPCKHANGCTTCSEQIQELGQPCPYVVPQLKTAFKYIHHNSSFIIMATYLTYTYFSVMLHYSEINSNILSLKSRTIGTASKN